MALFKIQDLRLVESHLDNPTQLSSKLGDMILSSSNIRAKVETANPETGEYRIVLQGTLPKEGTKR